jgi:uncharacterized membrane protein YdjX (TVP38/TMEM64 family)
LLQNLNDLKKRNGPGLLLSFASWWRLIPVLVVLGLVLWGVVELWEMHDDLLGLRDWLDRFGIAAPLIYAGIYVLCTVIGLPSTPISVGAGALFGTLVGTLTISAAATTGAAIEFLIARKYFHGKIYAWIRGKDKFKVMQLVDGKNGPLIVALTRLAPFFPITILNYGFGLTDVRFSTFVGLTSIFLIPRIIFSVAGADAVFSFIVERELRPELIGLWAAGAVVLIVSLIKSRKIIAAKLQEKNQSNSTENSQ